MKRRAFWLTALLLGVLAIGLHMWALGIYTRNAHKYARTIAAGSEQSSGERATAWRLAAKARGWQMFGMLLASAGLVALIASFWRGEPDAWRSLAVASLVLYILLQFMIV